jgi:phasin family protein
MAKSTTSKDTMDAAAQGYEKASAFGKEQAAAAAKGYEQVAAFGKDNVEAVAAAAGAASKGVETLNAEFMDIAKVAMAEQMAAFNKFMAIKTPQDMVELQNDFAKASVDALVARSTKIGEISAKVATAAFAPVNERAAAAMETFAKPFAS